MPCLVALDRHDVITNFSIYNNFGIFCRKGSMHAERASIAGMMREGA